MVTDRTVRSPFVVKNGATTCLFLYQHQRVLRRGSFQKFLCQTTPTGLQQPGHTANNTFPRQPFPLKPKAYVRYKTAVSDATHQLKEECRLAQRLGCWVRDVRERAALPLLWCGNTAGEKALFILTARWGQTPCSLSNTWWTRGFEDGGEGTHSYL